MPRSASRLVTRMGVFDVGQTVCRCLSGFLWPVYAQKVEEEDRGPVRVKVDGCGLRDEDIRMLRTEGSKAEVTGAVMECAWKWLKTLVTKGGDWSNAVFIDFGMAASMLGKSCL